MCWLFQDSSLNLLDKFLPLYKLYFGFSLNNMSSSSRGVDPKAHCQVRRRKREGSQGKRERKREGAGSERKREREGVGGWDKKKTNC